MTDNDSDFDWPTPAWSSPSERILGQTVAILDQLGDNQAVALLVDVRSIVIVDTDEVVSVEQYIDVWSEQPVTQTIVRRTAVVEVDEHLVAAFTPDIVARILDTLTYVADRNDEPHVVYLRPRLALPDVDSAWRTSFAARLRRDRPSNQARREVARPDHPVEDGLTFGSREELLVYQALKRLQASLPEQDTIAIAPLPGVRLRAGHTWSPDILISGCGRVMIFEIDGPHHRRPNRYVDDRNRDLQWQRCGVPVVRIAVEDLKERAALDSRLREEVMRHLRRA